MGTAREMFLDEKLAQQLHTALPGLMTLLWANHGHQNGGMFQEDILENIESLRRTLNQLEEEVKKEEK